MPQCCRLSVDLRLLAGQQRLLLNPYGGVGGNMCARYLDSVSQLLLRCRGKKDKRKSRSVTSTPPIVTGCRPHQC